MKKKIFLLAALLVVIIPFYNVKAITCRANIEVEYVNMDNLYTEETYITYDENDEHTYNYLSNTIGETNYVIYGDSYEIKNKKITGLTNYCKYSECYKDIIGKYAIIENLKDEELVKVSSPLDLIDFSYYNVRLKKIETTEELKYTYTRFYFKPINGEQLLPEVRCLENGSICQGKKVDQKIEIDITSLIKEIPNYKYNSYKIYEVSSSDDIYTEVDSIPDKCGTWIIRLYYKKAKQESTATINITQNKTIKMKSYFKDLKSTTTTISYRVLDTSIAKVDSEGNIKPLKVGETEIIATANGVEYILHLRVTQDMVTNPDTASPIIMILCVIGILISGTTIYLKDQTN